MDGEDLFKWILSGAVVVALLLGLGAVIAPHNVNYYYLSTSSNTGNVCVEQHWTWHQDGHAFCTDDVSKAIDVLGKLNATIRR